MQRCHIIPIFFKFFGSGRVHKKKYNRIIFKTCVTAFYREVNRGIVSQILRGYMAVVKLDLVKDDNGAVNKANSRL